MTVINMNTSVSDSTDGGINKKCFSCNSNLDIDPFGEVICTGCGEHQCGIFDLFPVANVKKQTKFQTKEWLKGDRVNCFSCASG